MPIVPGESFSVVVRFGHDEVAAYARISGDTNPVHLDTAYAATTRFGRPIVHGMLVAGLFSRVLGMHLPGPGTVYVNQELSFLAPVFVGDEVRAEARIERLEEKGRVVLLTRAWREDGTLAIEGLARVVIPRSAT